MNLAEVSSPAAATSALASSVSTVSESSSLFFMHDVGKGSTAKLEWKSSREPFNFGSFGITDPPSNFNLKTEERKDEKVDLCCDRDAHGDFFFVSVVPSVSAIVKSDSDLANQVNRKVCELDFAQSHMCSTLLRINAVFERRNSRYGELRALESEDCESIDKYVRALLQIDVQFKDSGFDQIQKELLMVLKKQLEGIVQKKLSTATDQRSVFLLRFYVFPPFSFQVLFFLVVQNQ
ncbi:Conserved oligomeric Golgi complex subunit 4 [Sesbania bispinosa]|nr:Conserved oligomeric Golgi complex subunit 4 [Sesbania bispinosa]